MAGKAGILSLQEIKKDASKLRNPLVDIMNALKSFYHKGALMAKSNIAIGVEPGNLWKHTILSRYQYQLEKQERAEEKYKRAFERATMTTSYIKPDKVQGGDKKDLYDRINDLQPLKDKVTNALEDSARIRIETFKIINSVESAKYQLVLMLLYIEGLDYKKAGARMRGREKMAILHNRALEMIREEICQAKQV